MCRRNGYRSTEDVSIEFAASSLEWIEKIGTFSSKGNGDEVGLSDPGGLTIYNVCVKLFTVS